MMAPIVPERETILRPYARVPQELRERPQWVVWQPENERKVPLNVKTLGNAGVTWPTTWAPFHGAAETAERYNLGLGFVLTDEDLYTCIDLDHCLGEDGQITDDTRMILDLLSGWVELSPSQTGLHVWVKNEQPINRRAKGIEIYSSARWITVTGRSNPRASMDIPDRTSEVEELVRIYFPEVQPAFVSPPLNLAGGEIWQHLFTSANGAFFESLYRGDISVCYNDHSRAVIMLANQLALLTDLDAARVKHLLYQTGLVRGKWEEQRGTLTWIDYQIQDAIEYVSGRQR